MVNATFFVRFSDVFSVDVKTGIVGGILSAESAGAGPMGIYAAYWHPAPLGCLFPLILHNNKNGATQSRTVQPGRM